MNRKKQRGQYRKLKTMFKYMNRFIPFAQTDKTYEHFHVPSDMFLAQKPADIPFCKVVAVLSVPHYWNSQIIIFYDESYFQSFWDRTGPEQFWTPVKQGNSFCGSRNIATSLSEICYHERIVADQDVFEEDLWFYGDVPVAE
ncbi:MAG: DUF3916 domain-containing protein [Acetatifactor sp.]|nr:DUF3916 domain-containing protein [Acetatifactor sp.]